MNRSVIKISEIKPTGHLHGLLNSFDKKITTLENEGYSSEVARILGLVVEVGITEDESWLGGSEVPITDENQIEIENVVLLGHIFVIRLNNIAQKHLNNIDMEPIHKQLQDYFADPNKKYFKNVTFEA